MKIFAFVKVSFMCVCERQWIQKSMLVLVQLSSPRDATAGQCRQQDS